MHKLKLTWPIVASESWENLLEKNPMALIQLSTGLHNTTGNVAVCIWEPASGIKFAEVIYSGEQFLTFVDSLDRVAFQVRSILNQKKQAKNQTERIK